MTSENGCADEDDLPVHSAAGRRSKSSSPMPPLYFLVPSLLVFGLTRHFATSSSWPAFGIKQVGIENGADEIVPLPPLADLVARNGTVVGDISWMLDFAIIAFPKAGTTFMKGYLSKTNETYVYERELCIKHYSDVAGFVREYHALHVKLKQPRHPKTVRFGLKCPGVFYRADDVHIYAKYFPYTKFIVGLRDPISWFESFYNYQSYRNISMPKTSQLIGRCVDHQKVCTDRARFHAALARLGKTPMEDDAEIALLFGLRYDEQLQKIQLIQQTNDTDQNLNSPGHRRKLRQNGLLNQVLLYELSQIHDEAASKELSTSIQQYLGISENFPAISPYEHKKRRAIDICHEEQEEVRRVLVEHGADARVWVQEYFLKNPSVSVSSPMSFHRKLDNWGVDPC
jgi:hypothetical protein